jgi:hypothetical protein
MTETMSSVCDQKLPPEIREKKIRKNRIKNPK